MSVEVNDGGLGWVARIDTSQLQRDAQKVADIIEDAAKKGEIGQQKVIKNLSTNARTVVQDGAEALKSLTPEIQKQVAILQSFQVELGKVKLTQKELQRDLDRGTISQKQYNQATQGLSVRYAEINENIRKYSDSLSRNRALMDTSNGSIDQKRIKLQQMVTAYNALSRSERENSETGRRLAKEIRQLDREITKASRSLKGMSDSSAVLNRILAASAGLFTLASAKRFITDIVRVRGEIEQLEVAFATILKSKEKANVLFKEIVQVATTTPFTITEVADATKQLLAYGFAAEEVRGELLKIGNVASGTGSTFQEVAYAYGTLKTQGRAFARDIRQFTTRGIPIVAELAKQFGVTEERVNELVSAGKVGFPEVSKAFESMTKEGGVFFNLMEEQAKTVSGEVARLQDKLQLMLNSIGESNEGIIKAGISGLGSLVENYETIVEILGSLVVLYGSYKAALLLTFAASKLVATGTAGMTAAQAINTTATALATRATALWGAAMNALPLVALTTLIAALVGAVYSWNSAVDSATASQRRLNDIQKDGEAAADKEKNKINELIAVLKSEVATIAQKEGAMRGLQGILGDYIDGYTQEEIAAGKAEKAIIDYTEALKKSVEIKEAFEAYNKLGDQITDIEKKGVDALDTYEQVGQNLKNVFQLNGRSISQYFKELFFVDDQTLIDRNIQSLKEQREALKEAFDFTDILTGNESIGTIQREFDTLIGNVEGNFNRLIELAENKADLERIKKGLTEFLEELAPNDPQIEGLKRQISKVNDILKSYSLTEENKTLKDASRERKKILEELNKMEAETFVKGFDKREQEIQKVKKQFEDLRDAAKQAGLGQGVMERIDRLEERRTGDISYRTETDLLKQELEKRKQLYEDLEVYAKDFGIQAAEARYSAELDVAKRYLDLVQEEYNKLVQINPEERTGVQNERLEFLQKELDSEKRIQQKKYDEFLKTVQDYETQRSQITEKYQLERQKLLENGDNQYLEQLKQNYETEIGALDDANAQKLGLYQRFFRGLETLSVAASRKLINDLRDNLEALRGQGRVTDAFYRDMLDRLNQAEIQTNMRIPQGLKTMAQEFANISREIGKSNKGLSTMLGILSESLSRVADIKANIAQFQIASKANEGKGDILGMATAGLGVIGSAVGGIFQIINAINRINERQLEMIRSQLAFQRRLIFGELEINELRRQRALESAKIENETLNTLLAQRDVLKENLGELGVDKAAIESKFNVDLTKNQQKRLNDFRKGMDKERETVRAALEESLFIVGEKTVNTGFLNLGRKTVQEFGSLAGKSFEEIERLFLEGRLTKAAEELFQKLKELQDSGKEIESQLKDIDDQLRDIFTGGATSLGLADSIISGFQQGKRAAEDFGDDVEEILRNAILSGFKYKFLEAPLNALLEQLYQDSLSEEELSASEIANFQQQFGKIIDEYSKVFEDLQNATGIDLSGITGNVAQKGLAGAIRREMTEATASELAGIMRGDFDVNKRHLQIAQDNLQIQFQIERNTAETVLELRQAVVELKEIRINTKSGSGRDLGLD
ncbi:tape measure protein [Cecembia rubra]|uniref:Tape measure domain-containing protein n=1 Tax=Cecembia rubra TaxID=1485585 RepID=A0A2P8E328_9BACT|nr:tape measure protein [Cecembia rubra]PSL03888.1 tape measure domain-containing protein [Cecembia rubra]